jgi:aspartyl protease family protein
MADKGFLAVSAIALAGLVSVAEPAAEAPPSPAAPVTPVGSSSEPAPAGNGIGRVTLKRDRDGHFYAKAQVNGTPVRFLIDTGATSMLLTREDARRVGIGGGDYTDRAIGAGGEVRLMPVVLERLTLGPIAAEQVGAHVAEKDVLPVSLMGQSFLSRIGTVTISGDEMVLR